MMKSIVFISVAILLMLGPSLQSTIHSIKHQRLNSRLSIDHTSEKVNKDRRGLFDFIGNFANSVPFIGPAFGSVFNATKQIFEPLQPSNSFTNVTSTIASKTAIMTPSKAPTTVTTNAIIKGITSGFIATATTPTTTHSLDSKTLTTSASTTPTFASSTTATSAEKVTIVTTLPPTFASTTASTTATNAPPTFNSTTVTISAPKIVTTVTTEPSAFAFTTATTSATTAFPAFTTATTSATTAFPAFTAATTSATTSSSAFALIEANISAPKAVTTVTTASAFALIATNTSAPKVVTTATNAPPDPMTFTTSNPTTVSTTVTTSDPTSVTTSDPKIATTVTTAPLAFASTTASTSTVASSTVPLATATTSVITTPSTFATTATTSSATPAFTTATTSTTTASDLTTATSSTSKIVATVITAPSTFASTTISTTTSIAPLTSDSTRVTTATTKDSQTSNVEQSNSNRNLTGTASNISTSNPGVVPNTDNSKSGEFNFSTAINDIGNFIKNFINLNQSNDKPFETGPLDINVSNPTPATISTGSTAIVKTSTTQMPSFVIEFPKIFQDIINNIVKPNSDSQTSLISSTQAPSQTTASPIIYHVNIIQSIQELLKDGANVLAKVPIIGPALKKVDNFINVGSTNVNTTQSTNPGITVAPTPKLDVSPLNIIDSIGKSLKNFVSKINFNQNNYPVKQNPISNFFDEINPINLFKTALGRLIPGESSSTNQSPVFNPIADLCKIPIIKCSTSTRVGNTKIQAPDFGATIAYNLGNILFFGPIFKSISEFVEKIVTGIKQIPIIGNIVTFIIGIINTVFTVFVTLITKLIKFLSNFPIIGDFIKQVLPEIA